MAERVQIGDCTLYCGDCRDILPTLERVDALITDPPYGLTLGEHKATKDNRPHLLRKQGYATYDDTEENLQIIVIPAITQALKMVKRGLVFCAGKHLWFYPPAVAIGGIYLPSAIGRHPWGFNSLAHCLFYGTSASNGQGSKPTAKSSTVRAEPSLHPCAKPLEWMTWAVDLASRSAEGVLDPFMGSGTTGIACVQLGRSFIGIEIEPRYFALACRRIEDAYKQLDLFVAQPHVTPRQEALL